MYTTVFSMNDILVDQSKLLPQPENLRSANRTAPLVVDHEGQFLQPGSQRARRSGAPLALFFYNLPKICQ
jgi:hypothetical protein